jgi:site-specific recombinase XerD
MENKPKFKPDPKLKLMEQMRQVLRYHHYAYRTEQTYCDWIVRYIKFHGSQTLPSQMGKVHIDSFLNHLATQGRVSASTQNQALNAIFFCTATYWTSRLKINSNRLRRHVRHPTVMTQSEVQHVMAHMAGVHLLMAKILYGCGLRLMECVRLLVQELDIDRNILYVRDVKGGMEKDIPAVSSPLDRLLKADT